jgi:hypothetical protein
MKLSRRHFQIKRTALLLIILAGGCAPIVARAPFAARPDTVEAGDLLGPFSGHVLDAVSNKPVAGAIVQGSWSFEIGRGLTAPAGSFVATIITDSDGKYVIPRLPDAPNVDARVAGFTLIVYKRGYVAYRSDRVFDSDRPRSNFYQTRNDVALERMSPLVSRVKHVRFVGGTGELKRALGSEFVEASLELTEGAPKPKTNAAPEGPPLDVSVLLSVDELRAVTGFNGAFITERLGDYPTSSQYDSRHFKAKDRPETYDAALRVWKLPPTAADARYGKLLAEIPHAEEKNEMGDRSLRGYDGRIVAIAVEDRARGVVIELTCGLDQCRDADQAAAILGRVLARADKLGAPLPSTAPTEAQPEKSEKQPPAEKPTEAQPETQPEKSATPDGKPETPAEKPETPPEKQQEKQQEKQPETPPAEDENQFKLKPPELKR